MEARRINLLFIVSSLGCGGAEKHVISLANHLDADRYRLSLAYLKNDDTLLPQVDRAHLHGGLLSGAAAQGIDRTVVRRLADHLKRESIDLIVCVNPYSLLYGQLARISAKANCRSVMLFHSTELSGAIESLEFCLYRPLIRITDQIVYVSHNQRQYWRSRLLRARGDTVIHNGIDLNWFADRGTAEFRSVTRARYGFNDTDCVLGLCAAMRAEKAHGDLLKVVARLRTAGVMVQCLLIGDGAERAGIERCIDDLGLRSQVKITGFVADVRPLIAACDALTIVSTCVETFSIAALEAMALGKPMIMSDIGGANEQVTPGVNGYLFPRGDLESLAEAVRRITDREHAQLLGIQARRTVETHFSLPVMVQAYDRFFCALLQDRLAREAPAHAA